MNILYIYHIRLSFVVRYTHTTVIIAPEDDDVFYYQSILETNNIELYDLGNYIYLSPISIYVSFST